jgi:hypothetical protein
MPASSEVIVTLSIDLFSRLCTRAAVMVVPVDWLVAGLVCDTIEAFIAGTANGRHQRVPLRRPALTRRRSDDPNRPGRGED